MIKTCTKCSEEKTLDDFYGHKKGRHGKHPECKICYNERVKKYRSVNKEKYIGTQIKWREKNIDKINQGIRERRKQNPDIKKESNKRYRKSHPEANIRSKNKRRARNANVPSGTLPIKDELLNNQGGMCANCKTKNKKSIWHLDHIIPISKGGHNTKENVQILCQRCNLSKRDKMPKQWAQENGRLL